MAQTKQILNWRVTEAVQEIYQGQIAEILFLQNKYPDGENCIQASQLYEDYAQWSKNNGYKTVNSQNFYLALKKINGVEKHRNANGSFYKIPSMEKYIDPEFAHQRTSPSSISQSISNTNVNMAGIQENGRSMASSNGRFFPDSTRVMAGMAGFSEKNSQRQKNNNSQSLKKVSPKTCKPYTNQSEQGQNLSGKSEKPARKNDFSHYKGFQSVGKLNSCNLREARNRSEKIKEDILACTNKEELQLVREEFGYLAKEIEWVWNNLLTKQQREQIKELTQREQKVLSLVTSPNIEEKNSDSDRQILELAEKLDYSDREINSLAYDYFYVNEWRKCSENQKQQLVSELDLKVSIRFKDNK